MFYSQARASALHEAKMECHEKWKMVERCCKVLKEVTSSCDPGSKVKGEKVRLTNVNETLCLEFPYHLKFVRNRFIANK